MQACESIITDLFLLYDFAIIAVTVIFECAVKLRHIQLHWTWFSTFDTPENGINTEAVGWTSIKLLHS